MRTLCESQGCFNSPARIYDKAGSPKILLLLVDQVKKRQDESHRIKVCCIDFSRAFELDKYDHLGHNMKAIIATGRTSTWVNSFFRERMFSTRVGGYTTAPAGLPSGVSQGSVLGSTLLVTIINDFAKSTGNPCCLFAYIKAAAVHQEEDIEAVKTFSVKWDIQLNLAKSQRLASGEEQGGNKMNDI